MRVEVGWNWLQADDLSDPAWGLTGVLYAHLAPRIHEILYIGKADGTTVRQRWRADDKMAFWRDLERQRGIRRHGVIVGCPVLGPSRRLTRELLADLESLLIHEVQPWVNRQAIKSRISRPGLTARCTGAWPLLTKVFTDS